MKKLPILLLALTALVAVSWHSGAQEGSYRIVVHPENPADSISKDKASQYLLKKKSRWEHGQSAQPVDLDSRSPVREAFSRDVHGRSVASIKNYWQRQIFSGRGVPPPEVTSDAAVIDFVQRHPGGVGYVSASARLGSVKEVAVSDG